MALLAGRDLVCIEAVGLVSDYLDGSLSGSERRRFERHLASCPHCTEYLAQMRETLRLAGRLAPEDLSPLMRAEFIELFHRWQAEERSAGD